MGLEQYGRNSIARVKEHFLPNKSARQLSNRYRHLSSSITWNPIKELKARWKWADQANLSEYEKEIVRNGIASFGYDWERISHLLPHRYPARFQQLWNTICPADEFAKKKDASDVQLPCSMGLAPVFRPSSQNTLGLESVLLGSETQSGDPSEEPRTPSPPAWTREEDKALLEWIQLEIEHKEKELSPLPPPPSLAGRSPAEIASRRHFLITLIDENKS